MSEHDDDIPAEVLGGLILLGGVGMVAYALVKAIRGKGSKSKVDDVKEKPATATITSAPVPPRVLEAVPAMALKKEKPQLACEVCGSTSNVCGSHKKCSDHEYRCSNCGSCWCESLACVD